CPSHLLATHFIVHPRFANILTFLLSVDRMEPCPFLQAVFIVLLCQLAAWSQETQPASTMPPTGSTAAVHRATIGLVLEGGGALGLAHAGVLRWLDENHIPIDYVAGTSMGGLVGGLYSTGRAG